MARGIAKLWKPVINVTDLDEAERFWSAVSGLKPVARIHSGTFSILEDEDSANLDDDHHWILLHPFRLMILNQSNETAVIILSIVIF